MIFVGFWDDLGKVWGVFSATWGDFGGSRACPGGVFWQPFGQVVPQRIPESDFEGFGLSFGRVRAPFWEARESFFRRFSQKNQELKLKTKAKS